MWGSTIKDWRMNIKPVPMTPAEIRRLRWQSRWEAVSTNPFFWWLLVYSAIVAAAITINP